MKHFLLALPILALAGCSSNTTSVETTPLSSNATVSSPATNARDANGLPTPYIANQNTSSTGNEATGKMPQVPPGMSMGSDMALPATPQLDKQIAALQKGGDKKKLAGLLANRGTLRMNDANAAPRVKYRAALTDYRAALKADPTNMEAKTSANLIESIYTKMGRPIPQ